MTSTIAVAWAERGEAVGAKSISPATEGSANAALAASTIAAAAKPPARIKPNINTLNYAVVRFAVTLEQRPDRSPDLRAATLLRRISRPPLN
jgi:hypothetical protein